MGLYRKKPVVIEAIQLTHEIAISALADRVPFPFNELTVSGTWNDRVIHDAYIQIRTLEGVMTAKLGDYVIKGVKGEYYPCKEDIFLATYEGA